MSQRERVKRDAQAAAALDKAAGRECDPERYCAAPGSAWANWYTEEYERCAGVGPVRAERQF